MGVTIGHKHGQAIRLIVLAALVCVGCNEQPPSSVYDPGYASPRPQPLIGGIAPAVGLANVSSITIVGHNFDPDPSHNLVFFDNVFVPVLMADSTHLQMKAPDLPKDSIAVKIGVYRAYLYSDVYYYQLTPAATEIGNFQPGEQPAGIECDSAGNVYVSVARIPSSASGVFRIAASGTRSLYSPAFASAVAAYGSMKSGPAGALFCVAARNIIFRIPPGGGAASIWLSGTAENGLTALYDMDFDRNGNIWAAGPPAGTTDDNTIFRIAGDKSVRGFPFSGLVRAIRVFNGSVFVAGRRSALEKIWRLPILSSDSLGAEQEYFNYSSVSSHGAISAITFGADGDLYVGTDANEAILIVHSTGVSEPLYPGVISPGTVSLSWGKGTELMQSRISSAAGVSSTVVRINMLKSGAPYYGRALP